MLNLGKATQNILRMHGSVKGQTLEQTHCSQIFPVRWEIARWFRNWQRYAGFSPFASTRCAWSRIGMTSLALCLLVSRLGHGLWFSPILQVSYSKMSRLWSRSFHELKWKENNRKPEQVDDDRAQESVKMMADTSSRPGTRPFRSLAAIATRSIATCTAYRAAWLHAKQPRLLGGAETHRSQFDVRRRCEQLLDETPCEVSTFFTTVSRTFFSWNALLAVQVFTLPSLSCALCTPFTSGGILCPSPWTEWCDVWMDRQISRLLRTNSNHVAKTSGSFARQCALVSWRTRSSVFRRVFWRCRLHSRTVEKSSRFFCLQKRRGHGSGLSRITSMVVATFDNVMESKVGAKTAGEVRAFRLSRFCSVSSVYTASTLSHSSQDS